MGPSRITEVAALPHQRSTQWHFSERRSGVAHIHSQLQRPGWDGTHAYVLYRDGMTRQPHGTCSRSISCLFVAPCRTDCTSPLSDSSVHLPMLSVDEPNARVHVCALAYIAGASVGLSGTMCDALQTTVYSLYSCHSMFCCTCVIPKATPYTLGHTLLHSLADGAGYVRGVFG